MKIHAGGADEPRWHAAVAVAIALALYVTLPPKIIVGPVWVLPAVIAVLLVPLMVLAPRRHNESRWQRIASIGSVAVLNAFNIGTIVLLLIELLSSRYHKPVSGQQMLFAAVEIWLTNVLIYALWYWEVDARGPDGRTHATFARDPGRFDFLFPQMALTSEVRDRLEWRARFIDYVFLAFNTATAFSPTDTYALSPRAKVLMMAESLTSLVTIAVIVGRAINVLGG